MELLLEGVFTTDLKSKLKYAVSVNRTGVSYCQIKNSNTRAEVSQVLAFEDILGCDCARGKSADDVGAYFVVYAYQHSKKNFPSNRTTRKRTTLTLRFSNCDSFEENYKEVMRWKLILTCLVRNVDIPTSETINTDVQEFLAPSPQKLLILLNPFSGPGRALHIFQRQVIPVLAEAGLMYQLVVTEYAGHARELVKDLNLTEWSGIVIVSGDGLIFEVVNGLMERPDWERAIKTPLGAIPGGSGNALSCAICHDAGESYLDKHILHASFIVAKHDVVAMDLVAIDLASGKRVYSFLSFGWGMFADVDIESEKYRSMGNSRFAFVAVQRIASMKKYRGRLSYLPVDEPTQSDSPTTCQSNKTTPTTEESKINITMGRGDTVEPPTDSTADHSTSNLTPLLPPLSEPLPDNWITIEDEFILVAGVYQSHLAKDNLMAPDARLADGIIHLVFTRGDITRLKLAKMFSSLEDGLEVKGTSSEVIKVKAFRLEPLTPAGMMTVDGERVDYGPIQGQVLPSMARAMSLRKKLN